MRLLVDTLTWLWMLQEPDRLPPLVRASVADPENEVLVSVASAWELAIKHALGRLELPEPPTSYVPSRLAATGSTSLPIEVAHVLVAGALPPHHRDPFDRLLIAQSRALGVALCSGDRVFARYDVELLWS